MVKQSKIRTEKARQNYFRYKQHQKEVRDRLWLNMDSKNEIEASLKPVCKVDGCRKALNFPEDNEHAIKMHPEVFNPEKKRETIKKEVEEKVSKIQIAEVV